MKVSIIFGTNKHMKNEMLSNRHTHRPSTVTLGVHACQGLTINCLLHSACSQVCLHNLQSLYSKHKRSCSNYFSPPPHCSCWKVVCRVKMLTVCTWCAVALNYSLNRHVEYVREMYNLFNSLVRGSSGSPQLEPPSHFVI